MSQPPLPSMEKTLNEGRIGMIDIGSNSIRLVVYDAQKRSPVPIYNEKVLCGLGKGLAASGLLNPDGVVQAKQALRRFMAMGRNMDIKSLYIMATAAVRDAADGKDFVEYLEQEHTIQIDVISGDKEARIGAYGLCSSTHQPIGISGDLGGGSLELVVLNGGELGEHTSVSLGSLRMLDETKGDRKKIKKLIDKRFADLEWLKEEDCPTFYAIGGSFRALAKMHMTANDYPLHILHEYTVPAKEFIAFAQEIANLPDSRLEKFPGATAKRVPQLPGAALLIEKILTTTKAKQIMFSASGIREGYLYEMLSPRLKEEDGLINSCKEFASRSGRTIAYANELFLWMSPLFEDEDESDRRLRYAFCLLSEVALHIHPEYRAEWAFERMCYSAMRCLTHRERVKVSLALYHRYQYKLRDDRAELSLISSADKKWAKLVGASANLAYHLSGSIASNLHNASLNLDSKPVSLLLSKSMTETMGEAIVKRLHGVDEAYQSYIENYR